MQQDRTGTAAPARPLIEEGALAVGELTLFQRSIRPPGEAWARLGVLHGYGEHSGRHAHFMEWMAERGVACEALDFRGQGRSGGRRAYVRQWTDYQQDLAAFFSQPAFGEGPPLFILGHSHGALILAAAALRGLPPARGLVLCAPFFRAQFVVAPVKVLAARALNSAAPWMLIPSGLRTEWMSRDTTMLEESRHDRLIVHQATPRWYVQVLQAQREVLARAEEIRQPLLELIADEDPVAAPAVAQEFFDRAGSADKTCLHYPGFLHEILREAGREQAFQDILQWMRERT